MLLFILINGVLVATAQDKKKAPKQSFSQFLKSIYQKLPLNQPKSNAGKKTKAQKKTKKAASSTSPSNLIRPGRFIIVSKLGFGINLREDPDASARVLAVIPDKWDVEVLESQKNWSLIQGSLNGWLPSPFLHRPFFSNEYIVKAPKLGKLNLRKTPNKDGVIISTILDGQGVVSQKKQGEWKYVTWYFSGWVFSKLLRPIKITSVPIKSTKVAVKGDEKDDEDDGEEEEEDEDENEDLEEEEEKEEEEVEKGNKKKWTFESPLSKIHLDSQRFFLGLGYLSSISDADDALPSVVPMRMGYDHPLAKSNPAWWATDLRAIFQIYTRLSTDTGLYSIGLYLGPIWHFSFNKSFKHALSISTCVGMNYLSGNSLKKNVTFDSLNFSFLITAAYHYPIKRFHISPELNFNYIYDVSRPLVQWGGALNIIYTIE